MQPKRHLLHGCNTWTTEKLDGECYTLGRTYNHARSKENASHPSHAWIKRKWASVKDLILPGWRITGEYMYAKHTIPYDKLADFFFVHFIWDDNNECLSILDTINYCRALDLTAIYATPEHLIQIDRKYDEDELQRIAESLPRGIEGMVTRDSGTFRYHDFAQHVVKYVRPGHVQPGAEHWARNQIIPNKLKHGHKAH